MVVRDKAHEFVPFSPTASFTTDRPKNGKCMVGQGRISKRKARLSTVSTPRIRGQKARFTGSPNTRTGRRATRKQATPKSMAQDVVEGDIAVAAKVQDKMNENGERTRIKEWLLEELESCGWVAQIDRLAMLYVNDNNDSVSIKQIVDHLANKAFGKSS